MDDTIDSSETTKVLLPFLVQTQIPGRHAGADLGQGMFEVAQHYGTDLFGLDRSNTVSKRADGSQ